MGHTEYKEKVLYPKVINPMINTPSELSTTELQAFS